jgi:hypothetical protein
LIGWLSGPIIAQQSSGFVPHVGGVLWIIASFVGPWIACVIAARWFVPIALLTNVTLSSSLAWQRSLMFSRYGRGAVPNYNESVWLFALSVVLMLLIGLLAAYAVRKTR